MPSWILGEATELALETPLLVYAHGSALLDGAHGTRLSGGLVPALGLRGLGGWREIHGTLII
jgi:hypothetical protein